MNRNATIRHRSDAAVLPETSAASNSDRPAVAPLDTGSPTASLSPATNGTVAVPAAVPSPVDDENNKTTMLFRS